ncbi:hypothetical protein [Paraglaciecola sp. L3A3]|uniref:hypothetical protein n=1 Tax=Paraglaciecola sp. L3A3 TaxID=2686358 RepID=UPI00131B3FB1|nr:hypothetical protein [Paraglaciecola sp. L3A3]
MSNLDYIFNLCLELKKSGKTPSVALVRNLANKPLSIPEVIKGLQRWKSSPSKEKKDILPTELAPQSEKSLEQRVEELERQLASVMQQLANLQRQ